MTVMKRSVWGGAILVLAWGLTSLAAGQREEVFRGQIADSQCALNVHSLSRSHKEMLKSKSMGGTAADCARYCVKNLGGVFVLQIGDKVYKLDDQELAEKSAGLNVKLAGILDPQSNTIRIHSIEPIK